MGCTIFKSRKMTLGESLKLAGADDSVARKQGVLDRVIADGDEWIFSCGDGPADPICRCCHLADLLCDYPVGGGKTCDMPMCGDCAFEFGADRHLCDVHWHMFTKKAGVGRMFPRGPRLVR